MTMLAGPVTMSEKAPRVSAATPPRPPVDPVSLANSLKAIASERRLRILQLLTRPRYLEEIASLTSVARQTAERHVETLLEEGFIRKRQGQRASGPVQEYIVAPHRFFALGEDLFELGRLLPETDDDALLRTLRRPPRGSARGASTGPSLVVVHGTEPGAVFPLGPGEGPWVVGRDDGQDIQLHHDPFLSNRHARIVRTGAVDGVMDTFSTNGTQLNWEPLPPGDLIPLTAGDVIGVGRTLLVYRA